MARFAVSLILVSYLVFFVVRWGPAIWGGAPPLWPDGSPLGSDFAPFYAASTLALAGKPASAYYPPALLEVITHINVVQNPYIFPYPPTFMLLLLPLALFTYLPSLLIWLTATLLACLFVVYRIAPYPWTPWLFLAFPGVFMNFLTGQNGFLSAALLGGGLHLVDRRPIAGGLLLGLLSYKPQLFLLIPLALAAGKRWLALLGTAVSAATLIILSLLLFHPDTWQAFFTQISVPADLLANGGSGFLRKVCSLFAFARLTGSNLPTAWILQGFLMLGAAMGVALSWRRVASASLRNALLVIGTLLFSPYLLYYDLALLALPFAWIGMEGMRHGWRAGELWLMLLCFVMPALIFLFAEIQVNMPVCVISLGLLFLVTWGRQFSLSWPNPQPRCKDRYFP